MAEPDSNSPQSPGPQDGWEMVCDGILRTQFGRRPSRAVSDAIWHLAVEEALQRQPSRQAVRMTWRERIHDWRDRSFSNPKFALGAAMFVVIGIATFLWSSGLVGRKSSVNKIPFCTLSDASDAVWASGSIHPKVGDALHAGTLRLAAGVAELTFATSAKVAVEGPAEFTLTGYNSLELVSGKISTDVPKRARGFTVKTPAATVVDLGTRFGAMVNSDHASEVDVFQGQVELTADPAPAQRGGKWSLTHGMAMIADSQGAVAANALPETAFPQPSRIVIVRPQNCGFDVPARAALGGVPLNFGYWSGPAYSITGPDSGIKPFEGAGMLRFRDKTSNQGHDSEVWQLIDLRSFKRMLAGGMVEAKLSSQFNRINSDARSGDKFGLMLAAFRGSPADAESLWEHRGSAALALAGQELTTDSDPATWEKLEVSAKLPAGTDFLIVEIRAIAPRNNPGTVPLFSGHFADRVDMELCTPLQPSSIATSR